MMRFWSNKFKTGIDVKVALELRMYMYVSLLTVFFHTGEAQHNELKIEHTLDVFSDNKET